MILLRCGPGTPLPGQSYLARRDCFFGKDCKVVSREYFEVLAGIFHPPLWELYKTFVSHSRAKKLTPEAQKKGEEKFADWLEGSFCRGDMLEDVHITSAAITDLIEKSSQSKVLSILGLIPEDGPDSASQRNFILVAPGYFSLPGSPFYHGLTQAVSQRRFDHVEDSLLPTFVHSLNPRALARLRPREFDNETAATLTAAVAQGLIVRIWKQRDKMSDFDSDILDIMISNWLTQARTAADSVGLFIDRILEIRGIAKKKSGTGSRSGYRLHDRIAVLESLPRLETIWVEMDQIEITRNRKKVYENPLCKPLESRVVNITDRNGDFAFAYRPGVLFANYLFGSGRSVALLSAKTLGYQPESQKFEKRLARYFTWHWSANDTYLTPYDIPTLLGQIALVPDRRFPIRTRDRFEQALDRLTADGFIAAWQYEHLEELPTKHWMDTWARSRILVEPPQVILDSYRKPSSPRGQRSRDSLADELNNTRASMHLSLLCLAEKVGISPQDLSDVEQGKPVSSEVRSKLRRWLSA